MGKILSFLKLFRKDLILLVIAMRNPGTPRAIKGLFALAILYLLSPIDLVPDFVPVAGMMDDLVIVPTAVCGLMRLLPRTVQAECEAKADKLWRRMPYLLLGASIVIFLWVLLLIWALYSLIFK